jgi:hypothetical protein
MIKILIPQAKSKTNKPNIRGFWLSPAHKLYYDYLSFQEKDLKGNYEIQKTMSNIKKLYNQEAVFYIEDDKKAFIFNSKKDIQELSTRIEKIIPKEKSILKKECKKFLKLYGGFTVYIEDLCYRLESWTA